MGNQNENERLFLRIAVAAQFDDGKIWNTKGQRKKFTFEIMDESITKPTSKRCMKGRGERWVRRGGQSQTARRLAVGKGYKWKSKQGGERRDGEREMGGVSGLHKQYSSCSSGIFSERITSVISRTCLRKILKGEHAPAPGNCLP